MNVLFRRREFIGFSAAASVWPGHLQAQQRGAPTIGYLHAGPMGIVPENAVAFLKGLEETGFVVGRNVLMEYRGADTHFDRFPALAADLVRRRVALIVATPPTTSAHAAKAATSTIPILVTTGSDLVQDGLVASYNRPGGTGVLNVGIELGPKRLGLMSEIMARAETIAFLNDRNLLLRQAEEMQEAARTMGKPILILDAGTQNELDEAFAEASRRKVGAIVAASSAFLILRRVQLAVLAARHAIPLMGTAREYPAAGGLISYGADLADVRRQLGIYAGRILKGEKPADLPVMQPVKFELVINLRTAKALNIDIPPGILAIADEVIE